MKTFHVVLCRSIVLTRLRTSSAFHANQQDASECIGFHIHTLSSTCIDNSMYMINLISSLLCDRVYRVHRREESQVQLKLDWMNVIHC